MGRVKLTFFEKHGKIEPLIRRLSSRLPIIKRFLKSKRKKPKRNLLSSSSDLKDWDNLKKTIESVVEQNDVVLIHSSSDGLNKIGISAQVCLTFLKNLIATKKCTIVMPCFPVTNIKKTGAKIFLYNPKTTICWTGLLPNLFLADSDCIRTSFPYNSLAAIGPLAKEMMEHSLESNYVYDKNSAWSYCLNHRAKILFLGVKASESNTMAIHMLPDYMENEWPVDKWYEVKTYRVQLDDHTIDVSANIQRGIWYKYVMEEGTSGVLKTANILKEERFGECNLGIVLDSILMMNFLKCRAKRGLLPYCIPKKYYKMSKQSNSNSK